MESRRDDQRGRRRAALCRATFANRQEAGRRLAQALADYKERQPVVLALPRGGVPVGFEIAGALEAPLDILFVRKLRLPGSPMGAPKFGLGAIVDDGTQPQRILEQSVIDRLHVTAEYIDSEARVQQQIIEERNRRYRGERMPLALAGRTVILVDDGIATGDTMRAALKALDLAGVGRKVLAVPVAPHEAVQSLAREADNVVCLLLPADFRSIAFYYADFTRTTDDEVIELLRKASSSVDAAIPVSAMGYGLRQ